MPIPRLAEPTEFPSTKNVNVSVLGPKMFPQLFPSSRKFTPAVRDGLDGESPQATESPANRSATSTKRILIGHSIKLSEPSVNGDAETNLANVRVKARGLHRESIPKWREAHLPPDSNVHAKTEHYSNAKLVFAGEADATHAQAAGDEEARRSGWVKTKTGVERSDCQRFTKIGSRPPCCSNTKEYSWADRASE
jgi:hypothetical protein